MNNIQFTKEQQLPIQYKGCLVECGYRMDIVVEKEILIELKSVEQLMRIHEAQILSYMKLSNIRQGFLINFNVKLLKDGLKSFVL
ncbi:MAG: GxxExxY protein [Sedimentisphaerales bacterium]|nr:GxxExxY protein [Sedimentisphaerales bacterium]